MVLEEKIMVALYDSTINFQRNVPSHFVGRLLLDGTEQKDARTIEGLYINILFFKI